MVSLAESLITALQQPGQERLRDLVRNPLCLTLLCHVWDGSGLPDTQAELYGRYLKKHYLWNRNLKELENHAKRCGKDITQVKAELQKALGELARVALETPGEGFRLSQGLLEKHLGEEINRKSLCHLALQLGLLNRTNIYRQGNNTFAFYHATFQEYFAALAIPDWDYFLPREHQDRPIPGRAYRIFEPQWKQVILVWLGRGDIAREEKEEFIHRLVNFNTGCDNGNFYYYRAYFLAAEAITQYADFAVIGKIANLQDYSLVDTIILQLIQWALGHFDPDRQQWITYLDSIEEVANAALKTTRRTKVVEYLSQNISMMLYSDEWMAELENEVNSEELELFLKQIMPYVEYLNGLSSKDKEGLILRFTQVLSEIDPSNEIAIAALVELTRNAQDEYIRMRAAERLGEIDKDNPVAIAALVE
ncbi:MAG: hypothetical protein HC916_03395 [Coleofasciculaceae cyanobacterium SM2_1_6]|nr:hypothetical protein [Coleofasciculaceae cyanobacterium SM2_1_6]